MAYFNKVLSDKTLAKATNEKELMALVLAIQYWRPYLVGQRFVVKDQPSLCHLLKQLLTTPAQQNWVGKFLGYNFEIVYKARNLNRMEDAISA